MNYHHLFMPIGPLQYGTYHMIKKPLSPKNLSNMQKPLLFSRRHGIDSLVIWKFSSIDCIVSFSTIGRRYGKGDGLFGMLLMIDLNLGLHHVQQRKYQKSYKKKNGRILQM
jgi:hypothetical protein